MECGEKTHGDSDICPELTAINCTAENEPFVDIEIDGLIVPCLLDTGATRSLLNVPYNKLPLSDKQIAIVGVSNDIMKLPVTEPLGVTVGSRRILHSFVLSPHSPCSLLGRDLLMKMGVTITLSPKGTIVEIPETNLEEAVDILCMPALTSDRESGGIPDTFKTQIDPRVWVTGANAPGCMQVPPVRIKRDTSLPVPRLPQYPLSLEATEGIRPVIKELLQEGVIVPCTSEACTPIYPVPKPLKPGETTRKWRLVHDLRAINRITIPVAPVVPNPSTILSAVPPDAKYFSVFDLASAFYSVPVHPDDQWLLAFQFDGKMYTWCRLPMGHCDSPSHFSQALKHKLDEWVPPHGSVLIQYVDDLLLCSKTENGCVQDSISLLNFLAEIGQRVDERKMQWVQPKVEYLGHCLSHGTKHLTEKRKEVIKCLKFPTTLKQLRALLGLAGYSRQWVPQYSQVVAPLQDLLKGHTEKKYTFTEHDITEEAKWGFDSIKKALLSAPALGLPNYSKPFYLFCTEQNGHACGVVTQLSCAQNKPIGYYSYPLDAVARGLPGCLKAVAAAALLVEKTADLILGGQLTLYCPHALESLLNSAHTRHFSSQRLTHYHLTLLSAPNVIIQKCNTLNPATFLPTSDDLHLESEHDCSLELDRLTTPRPDLRDEPIPNLPEEANLFVDGSSMRRVDGVTLAGAAVVNGKGHILHASVLTCSTSAQAAELFALCEALELSKGKSTNIFSDSAYAVGVIHNFAQLWKERGFTTASGTPIQHTHLIQRLLKAVTLPKQVAIIKCRAHTKGDDYITRGNALADQIAKNVITSQEVFKIQNNSDLSVDLSILQQLQTHAPETKTWLKRGATCDQDGIWRFSNKLVAPRSLFPYLFSLSHGPCHVSTGGMCRRVNRVWWAPGFHDFASQAVKRCVTCQEHNIGQAVRTPQKHVPTTDAPFEIVQIDFSDMPPCGRFKYLLVCVDQFSGWVEAYPTVKNDARTVVKCLTRELIPRFGLPPIFSSDRGSHFDNKLMQEVMDILGLKQQLHTPYRPQASGMVERTNQTLKRYLAKLTADGNSTWVDKLPIALTSIRTTPKEKHGLSPFDILFGRPPVQRLNANQREGVKMDLKTGQDSMIDYVVQLATVFSDTFHRVKAEQSDPEERFETHGLRVGEWVFVKNQTPKTALSPRWKGPFQIILVTPTAVKLSNYKYWVHGSYCKRAAAPTPSSDWVRTPVRPVVLGRPSPVLTRARRQRETENEL